MLHRDCNPVSITFPSKHIFAMQFVMVWCCIWCLHRETSSHALWRQEDSLGHVLWLLNYFSRSEHGGQNEVSQLRERAPWTETVSSPWPAASCFMSFPSSLSLPPRFLSLFSHSIQQSQEKGQNNNNNNNNTIKKLLFCALLVNFSFNPPWEKV